VSGFYVTKGQPLFLVIRARHQLFCEFVMPRGLFGKTAGVFIRHPERPDLAFPFADHVSQHPTNDQSTAQHRDEGWLLLWHKGSRKIRALRDEVSVTEVAPVLLDLFGIPPQPWQSMTSPAFALG